MYRSVRPALALSLALLALLLAIPAFVQAEPAKEMGGTVAGLALEYETAEPVAGP